MKIGMEWKRSREKGDGIIERCDVSWDKTWNRIGWGLCLEVNERSNRTWEMR